MAPRTKSRFGNGLIAKNKRSHSLGGNSLGSDLLFQEVITMEEVIMDIVQNFAMVAGIVWGVVIVSNLIAAD